jgi:hypothetical protein
MFNHLIADEWYRPAALVLMVLISACSAVQPAKEKVVVEETRVQAGDSQTWTAGMQAFYGGRYREALQIFESLGDTGQNPETRRRALYAQAATRMIMAQNDREFRSAMELWEKWRRQAPDRMEEEDPRMLWPLLLRLEPPAKKGTPGICEEKLRQREAEVKQLKDQIEALDAIHQRIEQKKKGTNIP